jgi:cellulose synthase (UDP-forming)
LSQHRALVKMLFCRPGQWKAHQTPGELKSIQLLLKALLKPRFIFERRREDHPMFVSQS